MDRNAIAEALLQQQYDMQFGQSGNYGAPSVGGAPGELSSGSTAPSPLSFQWGGSTDPNVSWKQGAPSAPDMPSPVRPFSENVNVPSEVRPFSENVNVPSEVRPFSENVNVPSEVRPFSENVNVPSEVRPFSENVNVPSEVRPFSENVPESTQPNAAPELSPAGRVNQSTEGQIQVPPGFYETGVLSPGFNFLGSPVGEFGTGSSITGIPGSQLGGPSMPIGQGGWGFMGTPADLNLFRGAVPDQAPVEIPYTSRTPSDLIAEALAAQTLAYAPMDLSSSIPEPDLRLEGDLPEGDLPTPDSPTPGAPATTGIVGLLGGAPDLTGADIGGGLGIGLGAAGTMGAAADAAGLTGAAGDIGTGAAGVMGAAGDVAAGGGPGIGLGAAGTMGAAADAIGGGPVAGGDIGLGAAGVMGAAADAAAAQGTAVSSADEGASSEGGGEGSGDGAGDE
jgi:hypothetical protein